MLMVTSTRLWLVIDMEKHCELWKVSVEHVCFDGFFKAIFAVNAPYF